MYIPVESTYPEYPMMLGLRGLGEEEGGMEPEPPPAEPPPTPPAPMPPTVYCNPNVSYPPGDPCALMQHSYEVAIIGGIAPAPVYMLPAKRDDTMMLALFGVGVFALVMLARK